MIMAPVMALPSPDTSVALYQVDANQRDVDPLVPDS